MDLYARFDLPPPPPPTFLSRDHGASRARFPEFQTAAELRDFIRAMTVWYLPSWILVTIRLTIVLLSVYLVLCFIVILKSFRRRSPWVLRFGEGEKRSLVVPHAHNCWTVCCMLYYCLVLACMCGSLFSIEKQEPVLHVPFWAICICMPVALGGWIQIWGFIVAAVPRRLTGALTSHKISARVLNAICFGLPPLAFILLIVPTAISDHYWHRVVTKEWPAFRDRYLDETELSHEMLVDAQKIWNSLLRSSLMLSIACIAWFIIGTALASLYTGVVWRTVRSLQDFLATQEAIHGRTNASSTSTGSASRPQFWPFSKKHTESSTAQKNPVPVPVWRPEDSSETMINMGHQHARHVLTCFIVQCSGILVGGIGMLVLAVGIAATLYPSMEQQTRAPRAAVLPIAAAVLGYVTLVFGAVNLISVAYSSFEAPFTDLLKANVSATESLLPRNAVSTATASHSNDSGLRNIYVRKGATKRTEIVLETESTQTYQQSSKEVPDIMVSRTAEGIEGRPPSVRRPRPFEAIVLHPRRQNSTTPGDNAPGLETSLNLPALSFSYYDQEPRDNSMNTPSVRSLAVGQIHSDPAPFSSYYE